MLTITCYNDHLLIFQLLSLHRTALSLKFYSKNVLFLIWQMFGSHQCKNGGLERAQLLLLLVKTQDTQMKDSELKTLE